MQKWILASLLFCSMMGSARAQEELPQLEVVTSEVHALYYLLECLIDEPHRSPEIAQTFRGRVSNLSPLESALRSWRNCREGAELTGLRLPRVQGRTPNVSTVLEKVSLSATNTTDFLQRIEPWLGPDHSHSLRGALFQLEPLFRRYYWGSAQAEFARRRQEIIDDLSRGKFDIAMSLASRFFDGRLPKDQRPTLALIPHLRAPGAKGVTRGHNSGTLQVLEILLEGQGRGEAGTVFHEFMHALWSGQSEAEKTRWEQRFAGHGAWGRAAYVQLNEGLATAMGNGWFNRRVKGQPPAGSWYSDPVIDAYGHALLPVIEGALEAGRPPSDDELDQMVKVFREVLPEALDTFDVVAADFLVVSSRNEIQEGPFQNEVMRLGPVRWSRARQWKEMDQKDSSTFRVYWLQPQERSLLGKVGWTAQQREGWAQYSLIRTGLGWELAFEGSQDKLFELLRHLQKEGLSPQADRLFQISVANAPRDSVRPTFIESGLEFEVVSETGIGRCTIRPEGGKWPERVSFRMNYADGRPFQELEGLSLKTADWELTESSQKLLIVVGDPFRLILPAGLLRDQESLEFHWVDYYR